MSILRVLHEIVSDRDKWSKGKLKGKNLKNGYKKIP